MLERFEEWGKVLRFDHEIPAREPAPGPSGDEQPVNVAERRLRRMLEAAGFPEGRWNVQRRLPRPLGSTTPDVTYDDPDDDERKIYIYLDGLSRHIHGNPQTRERDIQIRAELRGQGHEVIEITAEDLSDQQAMTRHFRRLARQLVGRDMADRVADEVPRWFIRDRNEKEET